MKTLSVHFKPLKTKSFFYRRNEKDDNPKKTSSNFKPKEYQLIFRKVSRKSKN
jgi:hypothetical protein